jgi:polysaccharide export outer membrane protein
VLLACLAFAFTAAWGADVVKDVAIPVATKASWAGQGGGEKAKHPTAPGPKAVDDDYIIGPADVLAIDVWKDAELTRTVPVRPDGKISLPLIGELQVSGMTTSEVQRLVTERLQVFISKPIVTVIVQEVRSRTYVIVGKIAKPGSYDLSKPTTVLEAIAIGGGFLDFAKVNKVYILRLREDGSRIKIPFDYKKVIEGDTSKNVELRSGDTIVVP